MGYLALQNEFVGNNSRSEATVGAKRERRENSRQA
jgi:hypothetical protein